MWQKRLRISGWAVQLALLATATIYGSPLRAQATPTDPLGALKVDGAAPGAATEGVFNCSPVNLNIKYQGDLARSINAKIAMINAQMQRQDYSGALGTARLAAEGFSYCYTKYGKDSNDGLYAAAVGHFLAEEAIAAHNADAMNAEAEGARDRARILLDYARGNGQEAAADLAALDALAPKPSTPAAAAGAPRSAQEVVAQFEANQLRFDSLNDNHNLLVNGPARKVSENPDGSVWIVIVGHTPEDRGADDVICIIQEPAQKAKAAQLNIPGPVSVTGTYHAAHGSFTGGLGVSLTGCSVIDVNPAGK